MFGLVLVLVFVSTIFSGRGFLVAFVFRVEVCVSDSAKLEGDIGDGVVLLHLEDGDPVEPAAVDGREDGVIV